MKKYKLKKGEVKELTPEQIAKHKSFKNLVANYDSITKYANRKPFYKNPKVFMGLILILIIVWLLLMEENNSNSDKVASPESTEISK